MPARILAAAAVFALTAAAAASADKPLKVFILAGQSNMQGHAKVSTFDSLADDPKTAPLLKEMRDQDGKPKVCDKVWITSVGCLGDAYTDLTETKGKLTAGFGAPGDKIGPEFTFGLTMGKRLNEPVLIIKTAWGGRSLWRDFRSPSAGLPPEAKLNKMLTEMQKKTPTATLRWSRRSIACAAASASSASKCRCSSIRKCSPARSARPPT